MRSLRLGIVAAIAFSRSSWFPNDEISGEAKQQICDVAAGYSLENVEEDYSEAIRRYIDVVRKYPDNALAHYHLGFALRMVGDGRAELR